MTARDEILNRLRSQARTSNPPGLWRSRRTFKDLAGRFEEALTKAKGEVERAGSLDEALEQVGMLLREIEVKRTLLDDHPVLNPLTLTGRWPQVQWRVAGQSDPGSISLREFAASADIGISLAEAALAETGTVIVNSGPGRSRLTALLPPVHLALVPASCLTSDIFTWTAARQAPPPSAITLISGPSKTADIEQTMAIGVHGPKRFIAVLYEDSA